LSKMSKKGALPVEVIAMTILILLVLVVLAIAFRSQISQLFSSLGNLLKGTTETVNTINISKLA